jgi:hypothetical protein
VDFIFMLTRDDQTVEDCLAVLDGIRDVGLSHVGFKDVGVDSRTLGALTEGIKRAGAVSYLEVVSTTPEACLRSARIAVEIGVDRLLGGTDARPILAILAGSRVAYYPFPGRPGGHPTRLGGTPETVAADCRRFAALGCAGVDLLAYRATEADPLDLVRAARPRDRGGKREQPGAHPGAGRGRCRRLHHRLRGVRWFVLPAEGFAPVPAPRHPRRLHAVMRLREPGVRLVSAGQTMGEGGPP